MDPSAFLEVEMGEDDVDIVDDEEPLTDLTEEDIVLLDNEYEDTANLGSKRPPPNCGVPPPLKKIKKTNGAGPKVHMNSKFTPVNPHSPNIKPKVMNTDVKAKVMTPGPMLKGSGLSVTRRPMSTPGQLTHARPGHNTGHSPAVTAGVKPKLPQQSVTWKYRPLGKHFISYRV